MTDDAKISRRRRIGWIWQLAAIWAGGIAALVLTVLSILVVLIDTAPGHAWLVGRLNRSLEADGIMIGEIEGSILDRFSVSTFSISDAEGAWLSLDDAVIEWRPISLLSGRIEISELSVDSLKFDRTPKSDTEEDEDQAGRDVAALVMPEMPLQLIVDRLSIIRAHLGESLIGRPATVEIDGILDWPGRHPSVDLQIVGIDPRGDEIDLKADLTSSDRFTLDLRADAPEDGIVPNLLGLADYGIEVTLAGDGALDDWTGDISIGIAGLAGLEAGLRRQGTMLSAEGTLVDLGLVPADMAQILRDPVTLSLRFESSTRSIGPRAVELNATSGTTGLALTGSLDFSQQMRGDLGLRVETADLSFARLISPDAKFANLILDIDASGSLEQAEIDATVTLSRLTMPDLEVDRLTLFAGTQWQAGDLPIDTRVEIAGPVVAGIPDSVRLPATARLSAAGIWHLDRGDISVRRIEGQAGAVELTGDGSLDPGSGSFDFTYGLAISEIADLYRGEPGISTGRLAIDGTVSRDVNAAFSLTAEAATEGLSLVDPLLSGLAGPAVRAGLRVRRMPDGRIEADSVSVSTAAADIDASLIKASDGRLDGEYRLTIANLDDFPRIEGLQLAGGATVGGRISGSQTAPALTGETALDRLDVQGVVLADVAAAFDLRIPAAGPQGKAELTAGSRFGRVEAAIPFRQAANGGWILEQASIAVSRLRLAGSARIPSAGPVAADIAISTEAADDRARSVIGGELSGSLVLDDRGGEQHADLDLSVRTLTVPLDRSNLLSVQTMTVAAEGQIGSGLPEGILNLELAGASYGFDRLDNLAVNANATASQAEFRLTAQGDVRGPLDLLALGSGQFSAGRQRWQLELDGVIAGVPIATAQRPIVTVAGTDWSLAPFAFRVGSGALRGQFNKSEEDFDGEAELAEFDISVLRTAYPDLPVRGSAGGRIDVERVAGVTTGDFNLIFNELEPATESFAAGQGLDIGIAATLRPERLESIISIEGAELYGGAQAFLPIDQTGGNVSIDEEAGLESVLALNGDIGPAYTLLGLPDQDLSGLIELKASAVGSLVNPDISGRLRLSDAVFEHFDSGFVARKLNVVADFKGSELTVSQIEATDGNSGRMAANGTVTLGGEEVVRTDIILELDGFTVIRRPDITARTTAELSYRQTRGDSAVTGDIQIDRAEIGLVETGPEAVPKMRVREVYAADRPADPRIAADERDERQPIDLDLSVRAGERIFVRGRGLDSEWRGNLRITGSSEEPVLNGELGLVRGQFDFAGNRFELVEGTIRFDGGRDIDPELSIEARRDLEDVTAIIRVTGRASNPEISISADPALPEDEVISRVLFGRSVQQLSALEAIQLAGALATLGGGGGGLDVLGMARSTIGLDRLSVDVGPETGTTVTGGKYLTDDVYLELSTATATGDTSGSVRWELTRNLSLLSRLGTGQDSSLSIRWSWDY